MHRFAPNDRCIKMHRTRYRAPICVQRCITPKAFNITALRHESVGKEDERCDESLKPFEGTLRVKFPSGRAGRQPEASLAC